ncbi:response regulator [Stenotrophomonas sp. C-A]
MTASRTPRILLVEDDVAIRELTQDVLKDSGYDITAVGDAESAVERLEQQPPFDLLISDVGLPGMNGRDLAEHAMARHPSLRVLLVTGYAGVSGADPHFLQNDVMLLKKPFTLRELLGTVRSTL